ncbi:hypothetical protein MNEG_15312 [Monoraphidium neglectum]|uniref:Uncharacterized protein n=1 Tax=Monoraphidium neglectum TaxID=145388 RepID=A0A0D2IXN0_9CHLO|nr:hypothetical protein MNEG_15312 [Monoraphidium neglectum]KIY92652.1 hypothetical protein MNEG_15312 [Monoraphidium neglectum]|eukprot:XP_013891672.1 hypothetical protein MNEG_15312 [Monoraphidium neglectum]
MEHNPLAEQLQRLQRWATNVFQPAARGLPALASAPRRVPAAGDRAPPAVALRRRAAPFAAIIPGDGVVETVFSTGLYNFM